MGGWVGGWVGQRVSFVQVQVDRSGGLGCSSSFSSFSSSLSGWDTGTAYHGGGLYRDR